MAHTLAAPRLERGDGCCTARRRHRRRPLLHQERRRISDGLHRGRHGLVSEDPHAHGRRPQRAHGALLRGRLQQDDAVGQRTRVPRQRLRIQQFPPRHQPDGEGRREQHRGACGQHGQQHALVRRQRHLPPRVARAHRTPASRRMGQLHPQRREPPHHPQRHAAQRRHGSRQRATHAAAARRDGARSGQNFLREAVPRSRCLTGGPCGTHAGGSASLESRRPLSLHRRDTAGAARRQHRRQHHAAHRTAHADVLGRRGLPPQRQTHAHTRRLRASRQRTAGGRRL